MIDGHSVWLSVWLAVRHLFSWYIFRLVAMMQALRKMAEDNDNRVVCPRSKEIFSMDEVEKVFVM